MSYTRFITENKIFFIVILFITIFPLGPKRSSSWRISTPKQYFTQRLQDETTTQWYLRNTEQLRKNYLATIIDKIELTVEYQEHFDSASIQFGSVKSSNISEATMDRAFAQWGPMIESVMHTMPVPIPVEIMLDTHPSALVLPTKLSYQLGTYYDAEKKLLQLGVKNQKFVMHIHPLWLYGDCALMIQASIAYTYGHAIHEKNIREQLASNKVKQKIQQLINNEKEYCELQKSIFHLSKFDADLFAVTANPDYKTGLFHTFVLDALYQAGSSIKFQLLFLICLIGLIFNLSRWHYALKRWVFALYLLIGFYSCFDSQWRRETHTYPSFQARMKFMNQFIKDQQLSI
jgi:hypothetical protein